MCDRKRETTQDEREARRQKARKELFERMKKRALLRANRNQKPTPNISVR